jgi:TorA maturation chaperone TorD
MMDAGWIEGAASRRARNYFLLSRVFQERPTCGLLEEIRTAFAPSGDEGELADDAAELCRTASRGASDSGLVSALAVEFTRLFGGLSERGAPPPIESVIREGRLLGDSTAAVSRAYADAGYPEPLPQAGPPDHLATELRFLALCCHEEALAWKRADHPAARTWLEREKSFLDDHVLAWAPGYCASAAARADPGFYAAASRIVARACALDRDDITAILESTRRAVASAGR